MIDFMGKKKVFFIVSLALIAAGLIGLIINGLQLDIQFQGGTRIKIEMNDGNFDAKKAEEIVMTEIGKMASAQSLQTYNAEDTSKKMQMLMISISSDDALTDEEHNKVINALREEYNIKPDAQMEVLSLQPFIGEEIRNNGIKAALLASFLIVLYIAWRFSVMSGLSAAMMAIVALMHDAAIMFSVYTVFQIPLNESFIAAILTILGYSMNDTIIVYDRIRENSNLLKKVPMDQLVNKSITQTLSRTINTTLTSLICIVTIYVFASVNNISSIKEFSLPLIIGLISGSYSSIFVASPLWMMWRQHKQKKRINSKPAKA